jgi:uncharacterized protein
VRSHLLEGVVRHRRVGASAHALEYGVYYAGVDLDELDAVERASRLIGRNRRSVVELRDTDHLVPAATDLRAAFLAHLRAEGEDPTDWSITLVTNFRILGYVFNPASFYLCRDRAGELRVVVVEVHNTHGERHLYTLRAGPQTIFVASMAKDFYVSPFLETRGSYTVRVRDEARRLRITINHEQGDGLLLHASLDLVKRSLTDRNVLRLLLRHPLVTHKTIALIHWHALRLWLGGARFHRHREVIQ